MAISLPERIFIAIYYCFLGISGLVLNTGILVVLCRSKDYRRRPSTYYLYSILISSILACLFEIPYYMFSVIASFPKPNGNDYETECRVVVFFTYSISTIKIYVLAGMSLDRFIAVLHPYFYDAHATKLRVGMTNVFLWIAAIALVQPMSATDGLARYKGKIGATCGVSFDLINKVYLIFSVFLGFVLPSAIMVVTNIKVFFVARKQKRRIGSENSRHERETTTTVWQDEGNTELNSVYVRNIQIKADEIVVEKDNVSMVQEDPSFDDEVSSSSRSSYELAREPKMHRGLERTHSNVSMVQNEGLSQHGKFLTVIQNVRQSKTLRSRSLNASNNNLMIPVISSSHVGKSPVRYVTETALEQQGNTTVDANVNKMRLAFKASRSSLRRLIRSKRDIEWSIVGSTLMLVVAFFITWSPFVVSRALESFVKSFLSDQVVLYTSSATLMDIFINPIIILGTRKVFRRKFCKLFTCNR